MSAWHTTVLTYPCTDCKARRDQPCVTVFSRKGQRFRRGRFVAGRPVPQPHRARRQLAIADHYPHLANVS